MRHAGLGFDGRGFGDGEGGGAPAFRGHMGRWDGGRRDMGASCADRSSLQACVKPWWVSKPGPGVPSHAVHAVGAIGDRRATDGPSSFGSGFCMLDARHAYACTIHPRDLLMAAFHRFPRLFPAVVLVYGQERQGRLVV